MEKVKNMRIGLSPRARGTHGSGCFQNAHPRSIPAGAGNTSSPGRPPRGEEVYPRGRGEHSGGGCRCLPRNGLSPRARGTQSAQLAAETSSGSIPAGAGNTLLQDVLVDPDRVYPRGRGEHGTIKTARNMSTGLSPRARGTPEPCPSHSGSDRSIPAGAGNTFLLFPLFRFRRVYPRGRGEHTSSEPSGAVLWGLSPRARGTLRRPQGSHGHQRSIPAGAGNTWRSR